MPPVPPERLSPSVLLLGWVSLLTDISSRMILPLLPLFMAGSLGVKAGLIGLIEGLGVAASWALKLLSGWLSDRWGRRKAFVLWGYLLSNLAKPLLAFATGWNHLLLIRLADKLGSGLRDAPRDALIAEITPEEIRGRAFGYQKAMDKIGALLGTSLVIVLLNLSHGLNYPQIFLLSAIPGLMGTALVLGLREGPLSVSARKYRWIFRFHQWRQADLTAPGDENGPPPDPSLFAARELDPRLKGLLLVLFVFYLANFSYIFFFLRAREILGLSLTGSEKEAVLGTVWLYLGYSASFMASASFTGRLSDRIARWKILGIGFACFALAAGGLAFDLAVWQVWAVILCYGLSDALVNPVARALISDLAPAQQRGTALGIYYSIEGAGLIASPLAGFLWDTWGHTLTFGLAATLALLSMWMLRRTFRVTGVKGGETVPPRRAKISSRLL